MPMLFTDKARMLQEAWCWITLDLTLRTSSPPLDLAGKFHMPKSEMRMMQGSTGSRKGEHWLNNDQCRLQRRCVRSRANCLHRLVSFSHPRCESAPSDSIFQGGNWDSDSLRTWLKATQWLDVAFLISSKSAWTCQKCRSEIWELWFLSPNPPRHPVKRNSYITSLWSFFSIFSCVFLFFF